MAATVAILGTRYPDFSIEEQILGRDATIVSGTGATPDDIVEVAADAVVIVAGSLPRFTAEVIGRLPNTAAIIRAGIGVDSVDLDAARLAGMWVVNTPDTGTEAVAQHTLAMALAATRRLLEADANVREGRWGFGDLRPLTLPGSMTAGVVGFGRIGRRVAGLLLSVGFGRLLAHDPFQEPDGHGVEPVSLDELLTASDVICLHAPPPTSGEALIGPRQLGLMKPGSVLVNAARGSLVDQAALAHALATGAPRVAALDVFTPEPPDLTPFGDVMDRLILSPHMAWYSEESQRDMRARAAEEARRILSGLDPISPVVTPEENP